MAVEPRSESEEPHSLQSAKARTQKFERAFIQLVLQKKGKGESSSRPAVAHGRLWWGGMHCCQGSPPSASLGDGGYPASQKLGGDVSRSTSRPRQSSPRGSWRSAESTGAMTGTLVREVRAGHREG